MTKPVCVQKSPFAVDLAPGEYYWCACGLSKKQPFCDGSHKGTGIEPVKLAITEQGKYYLCGCRASEKAPFCDGTHQKL
ncbi:MAG: CDGSH iron-sulfur domain-containing protein [Burkholderiales bacterium]